MIDHSAESPQTFSKLIQMTRLASLVILLLHFYFYCYGAFQQWRLTGKITDRLLHQVVKTGLFSHPAKSKLIALGLLAVTLLGSTGRKDEKISYRSGIYIILVGLTLYFGSWLLLSEDMDMIMVAELYMGC